ncbi:FAD binding domain-containing protein [Lichenifustis flavocetrariae]|uniref:Xanthine dehydrogenase family protein subunit M n=1 Tax=Lichenifustis flavocetrariae TaxID=2949735 RepID=A0AA41YZS1_9HYPH|nr:xanthine dehydrogenase family protein subunit M [Lichenifustis flavocetrariae]MCW6510245.1 xanthine dehydrogenase family protein subunit M [Lichenifustis flavocetrariae]
MRPFLYDRAASTESAPRAFDGLKEASLIQGRAPAEYLAGGTTLLDLMKLDVMQPARVVDITPLEPQHGSIAISDAGLRLGALVKMSTAADHPAVIKTYPVLAQSLTLAASAQLRNMATLGGNLLQRTRCNYFRDTSWSACNKRNPGSGCAALDGLNRQHAILGASQDCIATYPGDFAQALMALDATLDIAGPSGSRTIPIATLHKPPGSTPHIETTLAPGELITALSIPAGPWTRRSLYLKIRDRQSYEFALASAAIALHLDGDTVKDVRIALGGVASVPWRARDAEASLIGKPLNEATATAAARMAFVGSAPRTHNAYKVTLGQKTVVRALLQAATLEG